MFNDDITDEARSEFLAARHARCEICTARVCLRLATCDHCVDHVQAVQVDHGLYVCGAACEAKFEAEVAEIEAEKTVALPRETMKDVVFGRAKKAAPRARLSFAAALAIGFVAAVAGCHATVPAVEAETVGQLSASYHSVVAAPVHATTDFGEAVVVETASDDEASVSATGGAVEAPAVVAKRFGLGGEGK